MNKKSFTLIELLVVIAIIGILSSLVIARFSNWNDEARIANTLQWSSGVHRKLGSNLVGHWPLDGDLDDISGYGNHGSCNLGADYCPVSANGVPGTGNMALEFDGVDDIVTTSKRLTYSEEFTVSVWLKRKAKNSWESAVLFTPSNQYPYLICIHQLNFGFAGYQKLDDSYASVNYDIDKYADVLQWFNVVVVKKNIDGSWPYFYAYVNGNLSLTQEMVDIKYDIVGSIRIGGSSSRWWNGSVSDLKIYDTALTAEEVSRIYAETKDKYLVYE